MSDIYDDLLSDEVREMIEEISQLRTELATAREDSKRLQAGVDAYEKKLEHLWKMTGGITLDGKMWLTPRMQHHAEKLEKSLDSKEEDNEHL